MLQNNSRPREWDPFLTWGLIASLLAHAGLALLLLRPSAPFQAEPMVMDVVLDPKIFQPAKQKKVLKLPQQIVTEPESKVTTSPPQNTRLLAEKNRVTDQEKIKRGTPQSGPVVGAQKGSPTAPTTTNKMAKDESAERKPELRRKPEPTRLTQLRLNPDELARRYFQKSPEQEIPRDTNRSTAAVGTTPLTNYRAFSRPHGSGARFLGEHGAADHLPNLPDGDITLLNAKASRFAVFVRRVATQVFSQLRATGWAALAAGDIRAISTFSTVRATLAPSGKLVGVKLSGPSGSFRFDEVVLQAVQLGASDPHPPEAALAADGNIHFVFKAKSWTRFGPSRGGGAATSEHRWLLLATGLE